MDSIFITQDEINRSSDIAKKITYTNVMETIPENSSESPLDGWKDERKTEWRWRFMEFANNHKTVEISYMPYNGKRKYFNRNGEWVERDISEIYDEYVIKEYYYYSVNK